MDNDSQDKSTDQPKAEEPQLKTALDRTQEEKDEANEDRQEAAEEAYEHER